MSNRQSPDGRIVDQSIAQPLPPGTVSRYDVALAAIPTAYLLALLSGVLFSPTLRTTLVGASLVGAAIVGDALFLNPPRSTETRPNTDENDR